MRSLGSEGAGQWASTVEFRSAEPVSMRPTKQTDSVIIARNSGFWHVTGALSAPSCKGLNCCRTPDRSRPASCRLVALPWAQSVALPVKSLARVTSIRKIFHFDSPPEAYVADAAVLCCFDQ